MTFLGTPVVELVTPNLARVTGISLAPQAAFTIGFADVQPNITLPPGFQPPTFQCQPVPLQSGIRVSIEPVSGAPGPFTNLPPSIEKLGTSPADFHILITNTKVDLPTQTLEIYIESSVASGARTVNIIGPLIAGDERIG